MTDFSTDIINGSAKHQMIQALNSVLYGDMVGYRRCLQILEQKEQELEEQKEFKKAHQHASRELQKQMEAKDALHKRNIQRLEDSMKSVVATNFDFERTNSALLKSGLNFRKMSNNVYQVVGSSAEDERALAYINDKGAVEKLIGAKSCILALMESVSEKSKRFSQLALELEKCRTQCMKKDVECKIGLAAREEIGRLAVNFRSISNSLEPHSRFVDEFLVYVELDIWMKDFQGFFDNEEAKPAKAKEDCGCC